MFGCWSAVCAGGVALLLLIFQVSSPKYTADEPQPVPHSIPILGLALSYARDRRSVYKWASQKAKGQPFSMLVAGRKHYVFSRPSEFAAVYRNQKTLDAALFVRLLNTQWFDFSNRDADAYTRLRPMMHDLMATHLLKADNNAPTATKYFVELEEIFQSLDAELEANQTGTINEELLHFIARTQGVASTRAYYGRTLLVRNPNIVLDVMNFNVKGHWPLLFGVPKLFYPEPYVIRERTLASLTSIIYPREPVPDDPSPFIKLLAKELETSGMGRKGVVSEMFSILFGLNTNSIPNAYAALLRLISTPGLIPRLRKELEDAGYTSLRPSEYITIIPSEVPLWRSFLQESLRANLNMVTFREVLQPTDLTVDDKTYKLEKGAMVNMSSILLHENETFHPQPDKFIPERFLPVALGGMGENASKTMKPFGGGFSYCPGRVFAEKQIIGFLAGMIMKYEIRVTNEKWDIPVNTDLEWVASCPKIYIEIKKRIIGK